jgi:hypothetical protein
MVVEVQVPLDGMVSAPVQVAAIVPSLDADKIQVRLIVVFVRESRNRLVPRCAGVLRDEVNRSGFPSGPADLIAACERQYTPIAIYYSQASIRADWMFESRVDKGTWIRRFSSYESGENKMARGREALGKLIEDLGYQYNYVSYEQIANGELTKSGYRVLFAPRHVIHWLKIHLNTA